MPVRMKGKAARRKGVVEMSSRMERGRPQKRIQLPGQRSDAGEKGENERDSEGCRMIPNIGDESVPARTSGADG